MASGRAMLPSARLLTAEELERAPEDDYRYELVNGRLIRMSPVGGQHGAAVATLITLLATHVKAHRLGAVVTEVGFVLARNPDTVRAPDLASIRRGRIPTTGLPRGFWRGAPDLAIEVLSPDDSAFEVRARIEAYLHAGVPVVLIVDPDARVVKSSRPGGVESASHDVVELPDILPGFRCAVREIFE